MVVGSGRSALEHHIPGSARRSCTRSYARCRTLCTVPPSTRRLVAELQNCSLSSTTEHSSHGILTPPRKGRESVTYVSGSASGESWRVQREVSPAKARARSLVAWMAGRRETNDLKPIDRIDVRTIASHRAAAQANAQVAPKTFNPGGRAHYRRAKAAWRVVNWQTRYSTPAGW